MVQQIGFAAILLFVAALQNTGRFYWLAFFEMFIMIIVFIVQIAVTAIEFQVSIYIVGFGRRYLNLFELLLTEFNWADIRRVAL